MYQEGSALHQLWEQSKHDEQKRQAVEWLIDLRSLAIARLPYSSISVFSELVERRNQPERYVIDHHSTRTFRVRDLQGGQEKLVAVTVYKKGAQELKYQLQLRDRQILELRTLLVAMACHMMRRPDQTDTEAFQLPLLNLIDCDAS